MFGVPPPIPFEGRFLATRSGVFGKAPLEFGGYRGSRKLKARAKVATEALRTAQSSESWNPAGDHFRVFVERLYTYLLPEGTSKGPSAAVGEARKKSGRQNPPDAQGAGGPLGEGPGFRVEIAAQKSKRKLAASQGRTPNGAVTGEERRHQRCRRKSEKGRNYRGRTWGGARAAGHVSLTSRECSRSGSDAT